MKRTWRKVNLIDDPYYGKPYALLFAVMLGFIAFVVASIFAVIGLANLIMNLIEKI